MTKRTKNILLTTVFISVVISFSACSKSDPSPGGGTPADACAGKTITITATPSAATPCNTNGSIDVTATGSSGFTYKLNSGGTYQSSGSFTNLAAGDYTMYVKDAAGCEKSTAVTVVAGGAAGPHFTEVKTLVAAKCQSCHNNGLANGGMNFQVECNIITNKARIKVRAVDEGTMPATGPLTQAEKDIISAWITAGGGYTN